MKPKTPAQIERERYDAAVQAEIERLMTEKNYSKLEALQAAIQQQAFKRKQATPKRKPTAIGDVLKSVYPKRKGFRP